MKLVTGFMRKLGVKVRRYNRNAWHVIAPNGVQWTEWTRESMRNRVRWMLSI